ncbi:T9SS type A sorting domain-containing protein [Pontibacter sp. G13]|uniref:T9SS type A sorting domain-containing protein n=1 Tax=Pontibacter sp. G13 TaxID=3074898 RepID=UPI0028895A07|nr:T9SS type A sorting domain-containing protein [Pontibacter sp. G13]WNJ18537.1 T9SS type A sorting domain-containing protein [Pontibacter sp. G13]
MIRTWILCLMLGLGKWGITQHALSPAGSPDTLGFEQFLGNGFFPNGASGSLDSWTWRISGLSEGEGNYGDTLITGDFARGITVGGTGTGGLFALTGYAQAPGVWVQPTSSDMTPGFVEFCMINTDSVPYEGLGLQFDWIWRNDGNRSSQLWLSYGWSQAGPWIPVTSSAITTQESQTGTFQQATVSDTLDGWNWSPGDTCWLRWNWADGSGSGNRDESGFDELILIPLEHADCLSKPTVQATNLTLDNIHATGFEMELVPGDGTHRLVIAFPDSDSVISPKDSVSYQGSPQWANGTSIAPDQWVLMADSVKTMSITDAPSGSSWNLAAFEYRCPAGSEQYLHNPALASLRLPPANPTNFDATCQSPDSIVLAWNPPEGMYDEFLVFARDSTAPGSPTSPWKDYIGANSDWLLAPNYGNMGKLLYRGTDSILTIFNPPPEIELNFKLLSVVDSLDERWSTGTTTTGRAYIPEAQNLLATEKSQSLYLTWDLPPSVCWDSVWVFVGPDSQSLPANLILPVGIQAEASFGMGTEIVPGVFTCYAGTGTGFECSGLQNGTSYRMDVRVKLGDSLSQGEWVIGTPNAISNLEPGDVSWVSFNLDAGIGGLDQICWVSWDTLEAGTSFELTDNGFERETPGRWGDTEGTMRLIRKNVLLPAGVVTCLEGKGNDPSDYQIYTGGEPDSNWQVVNLNGFGQLNLIDGDQLFLLAGGIWDNPPGWQNAQYDGNVIAAFSTDGWESASGYGSTTGSTLPSGLDCMALDVSALPDPDRVQYHGPMVSMEKREWILGSFEVANWSSFPDSASFVDSGLPYLDSAFLWLMTADEMNAGHWKGEFSENWFDCRNWSDLILPTAEVDVLVDSQSLGNSLISGQRQAICKDMTISGRRLLVESSGDSLWINGTISLEENAECVLGQNGANPVMIWTGDWLQDSSSTFLAGNGKVIAQGPADQDVWVFSESGWQVYDLILDLPQQQLIAHGPIHLSGSLDLNAGWLSMSGDSAILKVADSASWKGGSDDAHVIGNMSQRGDTCLIFPLGDGAYYHPFEICGDSFPQAQVVQYVSESPVGVWGGGFVAPTIVGNLHPSGYWNWRSEGNNAASADAISLSWDAATYGATGGAAIATFDSVYNGWMVANGSISSMAAGHLQAVGVFSPGIFSIGLPAAPLYGFESLVSIHESEVGLDIEWRLKGLTPSRMIGIQRSEDLGSWEWGWHGTVESGDDLIQWQDINWPRREKWYRFVLWNEQLLDWEELDLRHWQSAQSDPTLRIWPNPAKETLNVGLPEDWEGMISMSIQTMLGMECMKKKGATASGNFKVALNGISSGWYVIHLSSGEKRQSQLFYKL